MVGLFVWGGVFCSPVYITVLPRGEAETQLRALRRELGVSVP